MPLLDIFNQSQVKDEKDQFHGVKEEVNGEKQTNGHTFISIDIKSNHIKHYEDVKNIFDYNGKPNTYRPLYFPSGKENQLNALSSKNHSLTETPDLKVLLTQLNAVSCH